MTPPKPKSGPRDERGVLAARILDVARESFAEHGKAGTTVRAVARSADVDPALVYHYYGSKDALLEACTTPPPEWIATIAEAWGGPTDQLGRRLVAVTLENWRNDEFAPIMRAVLLIAAHDDGIREKLRLTVQTSLMGPAAIGLNEQERLVRAGLVSSQLIGLAFVRYLWKIEPIASMSDAEVVAAIAPTLQRYIDGPVSLPERVTEVNLS
jgi:AcrR family transcriptional regulator